MLQTSPASTKKISAGLIELVRSQAVSILGNIQTRRRAVKSCEVIAELDDRQLSDAGIDRTSVIGPRPSIEVEAGLMRKLMSMR